jgi:heme a synthase
MRTHSPPRRLSRIARFAWLTLCWNVTVVLWGAYVRATGSGAGCGAKWPICSGDVLGASAKAQTIVEFTHRITSGISLAMVSWLAIWCWRSTVKHDWARYSALLSAVFLANEALLGAGLVLLNYVDHNKSGGRLFVLCLHFGNTLLLLATLSLTAMWLSVRNQRFSLVRERRTLGAAGIGLLATMLTGIAGAVTALADTLFPATSLSSALAQDFSSSADVFLRLRLLHPATAAIAVCYVVWLLLRSTTARHPLSRPTIALIIALFVQVGVGITNVLLLAPVALQIAHLFIADVLWILLVLVSADLVLNHINHCPHRMLAHSV